MDASLGGVGRDLGRLFQERPAIVVGAGVLGLIGISLLGRTGAAGSLLPETPETPAWPGSSPPSIDPGYIVGPLPTPIFELPPIIDPGYVDPGYIFDPPAIYEPSPIPIVPAPVAPPLEPIAAPPLPRPAPVAPKKYSIRIAAGTTVRVYALSGSLIASWSDTKWGASSSTAPASAPVSRRTVDGRSSATTTLVTAGNFAGRHVRVGSGVSLI